MLKFMDHWQKEDIHCFDVKKAAVDISYNGLKFAFLGNEFSQTKIKELDRS